MHLWVVISSVRNPRDRVHKSDGLVVIPERPLPADLLPLQYPPGQIVQSLRNLVLRQGPVARFTHVACFHRQHDPTSALPTSTIAHSLIRSYPSVWTKGTSQSGVAPSAVPRQVTNSC